MPIRVRKSNERGHSKLGWLDSYHTFSFAGFFDPKFEGFSSLRVINEDRVKGGEGFGKHPHNDYEIFSYVVSGGLRHNDSMGNEEIISRGDVQFTSAGKGIYHSEFNASKDETVHFIQMWIKPDTMGLKPAYFTKRYSDEAKKNALVPIVARKPDAEKLGAIPISQDAVVSAGLIDEGATVSYKTSAKRKLYVHLIQNGGALQLKTNNGDESTLNEGDGAFLEGVTELTLTGASSVTKKPSEVLLFDLAA